MHAAESSKNESKSSSSFLQRQDYFTNHPDMRDASSVSSISPPFNKCQVMRGVGDNMSVLAGTEDEAKMQQMISNIDARVIGQRDQ
jgi:hypothetical protein